MTLKIYELIGNDNYGCSCCNYQLQLHVKIDSGVMTERDRISDLSFLQYLRKILHN